MTYRHAFTPCDYHRERLSNGIWHDCPNCLTKTIGRLMDMLDEQHAATQNLNTLVHAHQENLIERVYALEMACPAGGQHVWGVQEEAGTGRTGIACDQCHASLPGGDHDDV